MPIIDIADSDNTATKAGLPTGAFTITRIGSTANAQTVKYSVSGTTAPGADYTALASSVTLAAGLVSAVVTIRPLDDTLVEASESIVLSLTPAASYTVGSPATATVNVVSDDGSSTLTSYMATREFDNKNGKAYFAGGPDGSLPLDDLNNGSDDPLKLEVESGAGFWREADYQDPAATALAPRVMKLIIDNLPEDNWSGTFTAELRSGSTLLAATDLLVNSSLDAATGQGRRTRFEWDVSNLVSSSEVLAGAKLRLVIRASNGMKVWATYSVIQAGQ